MIEMLAEKENVSFEEARDTLRACSGDLNEAAVYLERKAKASTEQTADTKESMKDGKEMEMKAETKSTNNSFAMNVRGFFGKAKDFLMSNSLRVVRGEEELIRIPAWLAAIPVVFAFHLTAVVLIISLFLGCRYSFFGKDDMSKANKIMEKAGDITEELKANFS